MEPPLENQAPGEVGWSHSWALGSSCSLSHPRESPEHFHYPSSKFPQKCTELRAENSTPAPTPGCPPRSPVQGSDGISAPTASSWDPARGAGLSREYGSRSRVWAGWGGGSGSAAFWGHLGHFGMFGDLSLGLAAGQGQGSCPYSCIPNMRSGFLAPGWSPHPCSPNHIPAPPN